MKLVEGFDSNYRYVLVAARRARQLQNGAPPVVEPHSRKACRIAEEEINAGKVKWEVPAAGNTPIEVSGDIMTGAVGGESDD
jgi:DNA-directed RNA polymerase subunit omega